jgi:phage tail-like protein
MASKRPPELLDFRFLVEIDSIVVGGFSDVSGLEERIETEDYQEGGSHFVHKLPKTIRQGTLTLKRGMSDSDALWNWFEKSRNALLYRQPLQRKAISVLVLDQEGKQRARFNFEGAYPVTWNGPNLSGKGNSVAIEQIEIVHRGMKREK